jgi:hypothetical protein
MGLATHLGSWLLGTVKNTTGTTAGTIRNMGATSVGQMFPVTYTDAAASTAFVLPAGAIITNVAFYSTVAFVGTSPTFKVTIASTDVTTANAFTSGTAFNGSLALAQTIGAAAVLANVGTTDAFVTYTIGGTSLSAGTGVLLVQYIVRNSDGTYAPTAYTA